jgi:hypothetical protein
MPEEWFIENYEKQISGDGFDYENIIISNGRKITVTHTYELTKEFIPGDSVSIFLAKHEDIKNELPYYFTYDQSLAGFRLSWISIALAILAVVIGIFFSVKIYRNYNPIPFELADNRPIGGWLVLPAIGLIFSPIVLGFQIFSEDFFNHNTWIGINDSGFEQSMNIMILFAAEIIYNFLFVTYSILVLILFFQKRSSVPRLISILYVLSFIIPALDLFLSEQLVPGTSTAAENMASYKSIGRSFVAAAIWIPYFYLSKRVKNTFCIIYRNNNPDSEQNFGIEEKQLGQV